MCLSIPIPKYLHLNLWTSNPIIDSKFLSQTTVGKYSNSSTWEVEIDVPHGWVTYGIELKIRSGRRDAVADWDDGWSSKAVSRRVEIKPTGTVWHSECVCSLLNSVFFPQCMFMYFRKPNTITVHRGLLLHEQKDYAHHEVSCSTRKKQYDTVSHTITTIKKYYPKIPTQP